MFSRIIIKKTGLPKCALVVVCSLADGSTTQAEVSIALERAWNESLAYYAGKNSYEMTASTEETQMQFATATFETSVTGRIEVVGFK